MMRIEGIPQLIHNLSRYGDMVVKSVVTACEITQALIVNDARADHPYMDRTGNLTNSIQPGEIVITDEEISAYVAARMKYASFVEFGTSRAQAYPFLTPAMYRQAANFRKAVANEMKAIRL